MSKKDVGQLKRSFTLITQGALEHERHLKVLQPCSNRAFLSLLFLNHCIIQLLAMGHPHMLSQILPVNYVPFSQEQFSQKNGYRY